MSSAAMNWAFEKIVPHLRDQVEKLVILRLADRADPAGVCWPGHNRTAADLNVSVRSVQASVKRLSEIGLLKLGARAGTSSLIHLQLDSVVPAELAAASKKKQKLKKGGEAISPPPHAPRGEASSPEGRSQFTPRGEAISPKSPSEPKKEPPPPQAKEKTVVVVMDEIHWPGGLSPDQKRACSDAILTITGQYRRQALVDELAGAMARRHPLVDNPPGWLRGLIKRELAAGVVLELAPGIASARAARAAARAREEGGAITIAPRPLASPAGPASLLQLAGRAAARQQLAALKRRPPQAA